MWRASMKNVMEEETNEGEQDVWEIRSYTWPPKSYSCSFCGREFLSAQALGGHMNVHRRDRARFLQAQALAQPADVGLDLNWADSGAGAGGGDSDGALCYHQLAQYGAIDNCNFEAIVPSLGETYCSPTASRFVDGYNEVQISEGNHQDNRKVNYEEVAIVEELDLELRLGHIPAASDGKLMKKKKNNNIAVLNWR